jgi:CBS domain containing-hemolysin-like protein
VVEPLSATSRTNTTSTRRGRHRAERNRRLIADGLVELEDFAEATGIDLDAADIPEDVETVGGLVSALVGRMAVSGEQIRSDRLPGYMFEIVAADNRRIRRVHILPDDPAGRRGDDKGRVGEMGAA